MLKHFWIYSLVALFLMACASTDSASKVNRSRTRAYQGYDELEDIEPVKSKSEEKSKSAKVNWESQSEESESVDVSNATNFDSNIPVPSILVLPNSSGNGVKEIEVIQNNPLTRAAMDAVNSYLAENDFEILYYEGQQEVENVIQMESEIAGQEEDLAYLVGLSVSSDVYIKFAGSFSIDQSIVELSAYETATARLLGSATGAHEYKRNVSRESAIQSATQKALPKLVKQIKKYWNRERWQGVRYRVVISFAGDQSEEELEDLQEEIRNLMKKEFKQVKMNAVTDKTMDALIFADDKNYGDAMDVYSAIRKAVKNSASVKKLNLTKKLIQIEIR